MIISHRHRFIFLKTSKTGSTSVEIALSKFCDDEDVITPIFWQDEKLRESLGYPGPRNYFVPRPDGSEIQFRAHMNAAQIKSLISADVWESYYKFCVVRNPWDRLISIYYWKNRNNTYETIDQFLEPGLPDNLRRFGVNIYTLDGKVVVNRICYYEDLLNHLDRARKDIALEEPLTLPWAKSGYSPSGASYEQVLRPEHMELVAKHCRDELEILGYNGPEFM